MNVQVSFEENLDNPTNDSAVPVSCKEMMLFNNDINMPTVHIYDTQQPIPLLKLLIDRGCLCERGGNLNWKQVQKVSYIASINPSGGARADLDPLFVSLFNVVHVIQLSDDSLHHIFNTILSNHVPNFSDDIQHVYKNFTYATIALYTDIMANIPATPSKFHCLFNIRDLSIVFEG